MLLENSEAGQGGPQDDAQAGSAVGRGALITMEHASKGQG